IEDRTSGSVLLVEFRVGARRVGELPVQGLPVADAAAEKLRPIRHRDVPRDRLRQQAPELRMVPAEIVPAAVAVGADAGAQPHHFRDQLFPGEVVEVRIHETGSIMRRWGYTPDQLKQPTGRSPLLTS